MNFKLDEKRVIITLIVVVCILRFITIFISMDELIFDEVSFLGIARGLSEGKGYGYVAGKLIDTWRPPMLPFILSLFVNLPIVEIIGRCISFVIGLLAILAIYITGKRLFNEQIGLYASLILASTPLHWFYSTKILTEVFTVFFSVLFVYFLFRTKENSKNVIYLSIVLALAFLAKYTSLIFIIFAFFILIWKKPRIFISKYTHIAIVLFFLILIPWFILNMYTFSTPFGSAESALVRAQSREGISSINFNFYYFYFGLPVVTSIYGIFFVLSLYYLWKEKNEKYIIIFLFVIFIMLSLSVLDVKRERYLLPALPGIVFLECYALMKIRPIVKNYFLLIISIFVILNIILTFYGFYNHPHIDRFHGMRLAMDFMVKNCSNKDIYGTSYPYIWWYLKKPTYRLEDLGEKGNYCILIDGYGLSDRDRARLKSLVPLKAKKAFEYGEIEIFMDSEKVQYK